MPCQWMAVGSFVLLMTSISTGSARVKTMGGPINPGSGLVDDSLPSRTCNAKRVAVVNFELNPAIGVPRGCRGRIAGIRNGDAQYKLTHPHAVIGGGMRRHI